MGELKSLSAFQFDAKTAVVEIATGKRICTEFTYEAGGLGLTKRCIGQVIQSISLHTNRMRGRGGGQQSERTWLHRPSLFYFYQRPWERMAEAHPLPNLPFAACHLFRFNRENCWRHSNFPAWYINVCEVSATAVPVMMAAVAMMQGELNIRQYRFTIYKKKKKEEEKYSLAKLGTAKLWTDGNEVFGATRMTTTTIRAFYKDEFIVCYAIFNICMPKAERPTVRTTSFCTVLSAVSNNLQFILPMLLCGHETVAECLGNFTSLQRWVEYLCISLNIVCTAHKHIICAFFGLIYLKVKYDPNNA